MRRRNYVRYIGCKHWFRCDYKHKDCECCADYAVSECPKCRGLTKTVKKTDFAITDVNRCTKCGYEFRWRDIQNEREKRDEKEFKNAI